MREYRQLLEATARYALEYLAGVGERAVYPSPADIEGIEALGGALSDDPVDPSRIIDDLNRFGSPATVASAGPRYFGYVIGGALPAALAANWLATAWDQNAFGISTSPVAAGIERIALGWVLDVLGLPLESGGAFVTGATIANFAALAAARHALLKKVGWDVEADGLAGAPPITILVGEEVHVSVIKALSLLGFGREHLIRVEADENGRMKVKSLPALTPMSIVCIQSGNVNTGAFDPAGEICDRAHDAGSWVHIDGAFGLWALASPKLSHLTGGMADADSWATDGHKWLNVPYDSGLALVRDSEHLREAMSSSAPYFAEVHGREPGQFTPESSRRARGVEVWAALRSLGRRGLIEMIERNCRQARLFAEGLRRAGFSILNEVVLNQALVSFGNDEKTRATIKGVQRDGTCWCGATQWHGRAAMRISVSSWATTDEDVDRSLEAIIRIARDAH